MDLRSGHPYWLLKDGLLGTYPSLRTDDACDVAVIGGGITGALVAYRLARENVATIVLDKRDIGTGSTAASTAMLMYAADTDLRELIPKIGEAAAVRSYRVGLEAISKLEQLVQSLYDDCGFERKKSLYLASKKTHLARLRQEYEIRRRHGFDVEFLDDKRIEANFPFAAPGALLSAGDAQVDAYRLTHALLKEASKLGARVYDRTPVAQIDPGKDSVSLTTERGAVVSARRIVFATGYESQQYLKRKLGSLQSTYAIVTEPVEPFPSWHEHCLIWETARPYFYLRSTGENRIIAGGEDLPFATTHKQDAVREKKCEKVRTWVANLFPDSEIESAFCWAGTFGCSHDGLAYIGQTPEQSHAYFAMGYGGNGITLSMVAADLIVDHYLGRPNPDSELFRLDR